MAEKKAKKKEAAKKAEKKEDEEGKTGEKERKQSQYRGVTWHAPGHVRVGKWRAQIEVDGKTECLGTFKDEEDAAHAFDRRAIEVGRQPNFKHADCAQDKKAASDKDPMRMCLATRAAYGSRKVAEQHLETIRGAAAHEAAKENADEATQTTEYSKGATQHIGYCSTAFANN